MKKGLRTGQGSRGLQPTWPQNYEAFQAYFIDPSKAFLWKYCDVKSEKKSEQSGQLLTHS